MSFRPCLLLILTLALVVGPRAQAQDQGLNILGQMGFSTLYQDPIPLELPDLEGKKLKLEDFKGKWVWLAFWATWCGPCAYEMPVLESLHQQFKDQGLAILGISVDQGPVLAVKKYAREKGLTFPILLDQDSRVSSQYQASAIPSLYVISPNGKLVGVYRGANNWETSSLTNLLVELLKIKSVAAPSGVTAAQGTPGSTNPQLNLPPKLVPPILEILPLPDPVPLRKKVDLEIRVKWKGNPQDYILESPKLTLPPGVTMGPVSSYSQSQDEESELYFVFPLTFAKAGLYEVGPVEISYRSRYGMGEEVGQEQYSRGKSLPVQAGPKNLKLRQMVLIGVFLFLLAGGALWFFFRRKNSPGPSPQSGLPDVRAEWEDVQRQKLQLSQKDYALGLLQFYCRVLRGGQYRGHKESQNSWQMPQDKVNQLIEEIRFGGREFSPQELAYYEKEVAKLLAPTADEET